VFLYFFTTRKIKVWDLVAALDPRAPAGTLCLRTLVVRALGRGGGGSRKMFFLEPWKFKLVSTSLQDLIVISRDLTS